jgi:DNA polymerase zeta
VFGVDFASVMSRGSQFKVESFMFRIAKPESFVLISPSRESVCAIQPLMSVSRSHNCYLQVGKQNAAEAQPLIFEPQSKFYVDPVLVLDFQSLYPSVMIGYNYCYSTCLGRVERFKGASKLGWMDMVLPPGELELLQNHVSSTSRSPRAQAMFFR